MKFEFDKVGAEKAKEIENLKERRSLISAIEKARAEGRIPIIAETKKASPSSGRISEIEPKDAAKLFEKAGACAISVLTDKNFDGRICDLRQVKNSVSIPVLRKEFIVDEFQIYESHGNGADAILLIAKLLKEKTREFVDVANSLGMETLVEIHDEEDLEFAINSTSKIIGINNRDLKTMEIELGTTERLAPKIPADRIIVSESGILGREDLDRVLAAGAQAALIGTGIMKSENIEEKLREFIRK
ncbi:MAG: indole-3-glycerol phosphate synthase TrpC [Candidatus Altiarchaeales archaeon]|nr:indole-3-glycerol phosphate synthase TrpC [Candidatus Altiarchaeota archaeon]MBU4341670.1 indole-3-glycerol phosphate synthase TrpC [Candidatus Altiarchaeota archaeon]MBU4406519.1 indole-3-glycerol phosphate synthase TrpC [Candidatus Altiarchaeota archaeon]MBU4437262.1 indole-3-glycerol phosphate synthase TrpC [Candidatus Altiarchaeota archaeon]MCG2782580.1 indole-3-glycerol phosphate synthase TrpC [Candidatus Altiarchaeales archaeon]